MRAAIALGTRDKKPNAKHRPADRRAIAFLLFKTPAVAEHHLPEHEEMKMSLGKG